MQKKIVWTGRKKLAVVFALLFLLSSGMLLRDLLRSLRERAANQALLQLAEQASPLPNGNTQPGAAKNAATQPARNYLPLLQKNGDLAAWLSIEGTAVDYPVMYTPDDAQYYLRRAFDGSYALSGSLFIGEGCMPDGSHILIYGHQMSDGTMFGSLDAYAQEAYAREHPTIFYDLIRPDGSFERLYFDVMSCFYSRVYTADEQDVFRYYYYTDLSDPGTFEDYVQAATAASLFDLGVTAEYNDRLLTLSTCSSHTEDGRFVVVARQRP